MNLNIVAIKITAFDILVYLPIALKVNEMHLILGSVLFGSILSCVKILLIFLLSWNKNENKCQGC